MSHTRGLRGPVLDSRELTDTLLQQSENSQDERATVFVGLNRGSSAQRNDSVRKSQDWFGRREIRDGCNFQERLQSEDVGLNLFLAF